MKKSFTLLESLVAIVLIGALSTGLFSTFKRLFVSKLHIEKTWERRMDLELAMMRMKQIFKEMVPHHALYTHPQCTLKCVRPLDRDPHFCGPVTYRLSLRKDELWLTTQNIKGITREELLLTHVEKFDVQCFDKDWLSQWGKERVYLPKMVKFCVRVKDLGDLSFAFFLEHLHS